MFDVVVFAPWPRGLYLCKKFSEKGKKVAFIELLPVLKNPFGLFLDENSQEEKKFFESLGFLFRQNSGFCLLSSQGVWPMGDMKEMEDRHPVLKNHISEDSSLDFKNHWIAYLSLNLNSRIFEYNNSNFSNKTLNLMKDYFLFETSFKKREQFQKDHFQIEFLKKEIEDISWNHKTKEFSIDKKPLPSEQYFWFGDNFDLFSKKGKTLKPQWQWESFFFKADFKDYRQIIPSHFVSLKNIKLPWCHDNLLSVFHKEGQLEVWAKKSYNQEQENFQEAIKKHLESFFLSCKIEILEKKSVKSFVIYGQEALNSGGFIVKDKLYVEDFNVFFQGDLMSKICKEKEFCNSL